MLTTNQPNTANKVFTPKAPVVFHGGNPATGLKPTEKATLLKVFNGTRKGEVAYVIEAKYEKQTDAENRLSPQDFQIPSNVSAKLHIGKVVKAEQAANGGFYITIADHLRSDSGRIGFTAMRLTGLKSFKILKEVPGPLLSDIIDIV